MLLEAFGIVVHQIQKDLFWFLGIPIRIHLEITVDE